ncbi:MAG: hypothetical protein A3C14_05410 [Candidatus Lloydbacteria bacterium RIFCSPHIGHO2_02_FULL_50_18]|nr:MAG: hypothetical protein A3C14_05410 [Candidatus Lloydbacteria bacterium RIFCSPHIGHO2_02_FULL_50_18]
MDTSEGRGNRDKHLNSREEFSYKKEPKTFFPEHDLYSFNIRFSKHAEFFHIVQSACADDLVEQYVSHCVSQCTDDRCWNDPQIARTHKIAHQDIENLA